MENKIKADNQEYIENNISRICALRQEIGYLTIEKSNLEADYRVKCEEEEEAKAILKNRLELVDLVYMMKKSKLTDKLAERIENRIESIETQALINCYACEKEHLSGKLDKIISSIEQKENEIYKLQREMW